MLRTTVALAIASVVTPFALAGEIRVQCYPDGNECEMTRTSSSGSNRRTPTSRSSSTRCRYKAVLETLPVQLAAGEGPDIARVTDLGGLSGYYLEITPYAEKTRRRGKQTSGKTLKWMRPTPSDKGSTG